LGAERKGKNGGVRHNSMRKERENGTYWGHRRNNQRR
jgi:hypothetical protein